MPNPYAFPLSRRTNQYTAKSRAVGSKGQLYAHSTRFVSQRWRCGQKHIYWLLEHVLYFKHWKTGRIILWIKQFTRKSLLQRNMCKFHLFFQKHLFHTCLNVFGLKITPRMFRAASRTPEWGTMWLHRKRDSENQKICVWHLFKAFFVWQHYLWHPSPRHLVFPLHEKQHACFSASSKSWPVLTR